MEVVIDPAIIIVSEAYPTDDQLILNTPSSYTFKFTSESDISDGDILTITFPTDDFEVTRDTSCSTTGFRVTPTDCESFRTGVIVITDFTDTTIVSG